MSNSIDIDAFKRKLNDLLIEKDGDVGNDDLVHFRRDAKDLGLDERQLNKLLQEVNGNINWDHIYSLRAIQKKVQEEKIESLRNAKEILKLIVKQCSRDGVFEINEIISYFQTADELGQNEKLIATALKNYFEKNNYFPVSTPKGKTLRLCLESTEWRKDYDQKSLNVIEKKKEPIESIQKESRPLATKRYYVSDLILSTYDNYYQEEFRKIIEGNGAYKGKWNWFAFFFSWIWCLFKGCWACSIFILLTFLITYGSSIYYLIVLGISVLIGARGTWLYYNVKFKHNHFPKIF